MAEPGDEIAPDPSRACTEPGTSRLATRQREPSDGRAELPQVAGYEILEEVGRGGMGVVYRARQKSLEREVALKLILAGSHAGATEMGRFRTEAQAIARLQHPNIVQIYEIGEQHGLPFLALEFCADGTLEQKLQGTPWPAREAAQLIETLARAVQAAHERQVIHRDLKPANILLQIADSRLQIADLSRQSAICNLQSAIPKITDFGLAKRLDEPGLTASGAVLGTPSYMAPEQAEGRSREVGPVTDVYALGALLYELLTGRPPFRAATALETVLQVISDEPVAPRQLQPRTPRDLETICLKCLQKERTRRYASALDLAEDLRRFQAGEPIRARPVGRLQRGWRWCRRHPAPAGLGAGVALLLLVVAIGGTTIPPSPGCGRARTSRRSPGSCPTRERRPNDRLHRSGAYLAAVSRGKHATFS
jgi:serine/threonine protein kinase